MIEARFIKSNFFFQVAETEEVKGMSAEAVFPSAGDRLAAGNKISSAVAEMRSAIRLLVKFVF